MHQINKSQFIGYEDLMRELTIFEHQLMQENPSMAMDLMVLEAKIRDRFQKIQRAKLGLSDPIEDPGFPFTDNLSLDEIKAMIPQDLDLLSQFDEPPAVQRKRKFLETIGMAALLAVMTALGVFGLASALQLVLNWLA